MNKDFKLFMSQLQETNQTLDFFCDFNKISQNVEDIKLSLCMLNSLIGSADMRKSVETIWKRDKAAFNVMDILIAVRSEGKKKRKGSSLLQLRLDEANQRWQTDDRCLAFTCYCALGEVVRQASNPEANPIAGTYHHGIDTDGRMDSRPVCRQ